MVLFYDNEVKKAPPTGWRKYVRRFFKAAFVLTLLLFAALWALSAVGGNSKALRLGIQDYLTDTTGYLAQMDRLESMKFFPVTHIQFGNLTLHEPVRKDMTDPERDAEDQRRRDAGEMPQPKGISDFYDPGAVVASVGAADLRMNFWDIFLSRRRFYVLDVRDIKIGEGIWLPRAVHVKSLKAGPDDGTLAITAQGDYGPHEFAIRVGTVQKVPGLYEIPDRAPFRLRAGPLSMEGTLDSAPGRAARAEIDAMEIGGHHFTGNLTMEERRKRTHVTFELKTGNSHIKAALDVRNRDITGTITAVTLDIDDIATIHQAYDGIMTLWGAMRDDRVVFGRHNMDVKLVVEKLTNGTGGWGEVKADMKLQPYRLQLENIRGLVNGGALKGGFSIDATGAGDAQLKADMQLRGWDYARDSAAVTAQADAYLTLTGAGKTFAALERNLKGALVVIGGEGNLTRDTALYGGGTMMKAMLPEREGGEPLEMNCMMADFDIDGTTARARTLFMDMSGLTIAGTGTLDILARTLDLKLTPDSATPGRRAVRVKGHMEAPEITAEGAARDKKTGVMPGTLESASLAIGFKDLDLGGSHPCHAFLKQP